MRAFWMSWGIVFLLSSTSHGDDWPQWLGPQRDGVWRETGILDKLPPDGPKVVWRTAVAQGYSGPAVAKGRVYVTDWVQGPGGKPAPVAIQKGDQPGQERILCFDEAKGELMWKHEYDSAYRVSYAAGPRVTPLVHEGKVYTIGTMGDLLCLDAEKGTVLWKKHFVTDYRAEVPLWGFASQPIIFGSTIICLVGGKDALVVAFDRQNGTEVWKALNDTEPGYAPLMLYQAGGVEQLIVWHPAAVTSLHPKTGSVFWSEKFTVNRGLTIPTPRLHGDRLFLTAFYDGSLMLKLAADKPTATVDWRLGGKNERPSSTKALHSIMTTPVFKGEYIYGIDSYGELRCLNAANGERLWSTQKVTGPKVERWGNAFLIENGDRFFLFNEKGELIIAKLTPQGYDEISRAKILEPTNTLVNRPVVWMHPAFANKRMYARNDKELICVDLAAR